MISRARRTLLAGVVGVVTASVAGVCTLTVAEAAPRPEGSSARQVAADGAPPSAVEDFAYPGADKILKEKGVKLVKGDGHILLAECGSGAWNIKVESNKDKGIQAYCFKVIGKSGYLALEVPRSVGIWNDDHSVRATLTSEGKSKTIDVAKDDVTIVGEADMPSGAKQATLVELRVTG